MLVILDIADPWPRPDSFGEAQWAAVKGIRYGVEQCAWDALDDWPLVHVVYQPKFNPRRPYADSFPGYMESDQDYVLNNLELCVEFLESLE